MGSICSYNSLKLCILCKLHIKYIGVNGYINTVLINLYIFILFQLSSNSQFQIMIHRNIFFYSVILNGLKWIAIWFVYQKHRQCFSWQLPFFSVLDSPLPFIRSLSLLLFPLHSMFYRRSAFRFLQYCNFSCSELRQFSKRKCRKVERVRKREVGRAKERTRIYEWRFIKKRI